MTDNLTRIRSDMHAAHVRAVHELDRFVVQQGVMAPESVRTAVSELFQLAEEWEDTSNRLAELLEEANSTTLDDPEIKQDEAREAG